jgi:hypothetical protein
VGRRWVAPISWDGGDTWHNFCQDAHHSSYRVSQRPDVLQDDYHIAATDSRPEFWAQQSDHIPPPP